jgi:hypothetical protein
MMTDQGAEPEAANTRSKQLLQTYPQGACLFAADLMGIQKIYQWIQPIWEHRSTKNQTKTGTKCI